jgi:hypothetical protein
VDWGLSLRPQSIPREERGEPTSRFRYVVCPRPVFSRRVQRSAIPGAEGSVEGGALVDLERASERVLSAGPLFAEQRTHNADAPPPACMAVPWHQDPRAHGRTHAVRSQNGHIKGAQGVLPVHAQGHAQGGNRCAQGGHRCALPSKDKSTRARPAPRQKKLRKAQKKTTDETQRDASTRGDKRQNSCRTSVRDLGAMMDPVPRATIARRELGECAQIRGSVGSREGG